MRQLDSVRTREQEQYLVDVVAMLAFDCFFRQIRGVPRLHSLGSFWGC